MLWNVITSQLIRTLCLASGVLSILPTPASSQTTWVAGGGNSCFVSCRNSGFEPVKSGFHLGREFTVCRIVLSGYNASHRPGYNLEPNWANACWVGLGGKEYSSATHRFGYDCLCTKLPVSEGPSPEARIAWVPGRSSSCDDTCRSPGAGTRMNAVASGPRWIPKTPSPTGPPYFVCRGNGGAAAGLRPGYNLRPNWASACTVGFGGREVSFPHDCLCQR